MGVHVAIEFERPESNLLSTRNQGIEQCINADDGVSTLRKRCSWYTDLPPLGKRKIRLTMSRSFIRRGNWTDMRIDHDVVGTQTRRKGKPGGWAICDAVHRGLRGSDKARRHDSRIMEWLLRLVGAGGF